MLDTLAQTIERVGRSCLESFKAGKYFVQLHDLCLMEIQKVDSARRQPHVMRILAEETVEKMEHVLLLFDIGVEAISPGHLPFWQWYLHAVESGIVLDTELRRYETAKRLAATFLENSYITEDGMTDYKTQRYAYAQSDVPLPEWFRPNEVCAILEEIATAYAFLLFAVMDYALESTGAA